MLIFIPTAIINSRNISPIPSSRNILIGKILGRLWSFDHLLDIRGLHHTGLSLRLLFLGEEHLVACLRDFMLSIIGPGILGNAIRALHFNSEDIFPHLRAEIAHFPPRLSPTVPHYPVGGLPFRGPPDHGNIVVQLRGISHCWLPDYPARVVPKGGAIHTAMDRPALVNLVHHFLDPRELAVFGNRVNVVRINRTATAVRSAGFADHLLRTWQPVVFKLFHKNKIKSNFITMAPSLID